MAEVPFSNRMIYVVVLPPNTSIECLSDVEIEVAINEYGFSEA